MPKYLSAKSYSLVKDYGLFTIDGILPHPKLFVIIYDTSGKKNDRQALWRIVLD